mgnify:CR=1 FL=1
MNFINDKISLHLNYHGNVLIIDSFMNLALHHGGSRVVLYETFPSSLWHLEVLGEALLPEVLDGIVVGISHKVLDAYCLSMGFQTVHQSRTITFHLLRGRNCKENNFCKTLGVERPEHTPS